MPMHKTLRIIQLNVHKRDAVQLSLMNDKEIRDFGVVAISEPYARIIENMVVTSPMGHHNWTRMIPTERREAIWPIRSMLWVRSDIDAEQIPVPSADLTAAVLQLPDRAVMVVSVYVEGRNADALASTVRELHNLIVRFRSGRGTRTDVILVGDFNQHDQLWGGDDVSPTRQGEADLLIDFMSEHSLQSLLPRGTKTWQEGDTETTIDLVLASTELAEEVMRCGIHQNEHGSDHRAIETAFDVVVHDRPASQRLLFKNAPWTEIRAKVDASLQRVPLGGSVQFQTDRLMAAVTEAVFELTPKAKPSPYAKRWWTTDLTQLRRSYTYWRNQARFQRRIGRGIPELVRRARESAKEYHDTIRKQKKAHWEDFLADDTNIWQATKYLNPGSSAFSDKIPPLIKPDGSTTKDKTEQAEELLRTFFPPLPAEIEDEGPQPQRTLVHMPDLSMGEIEQKVMAAKPWKAPGEDGLPAMVWRQLWPVVKDRVLLLFRTSLWDGELPTQWRNAKIVPLKKDGKDDYTKAKSWRPISLLSTLGKILEAVIAERISHAAETFGLLPTNHFGARKRRSAEQALLLLQEQIYKAWRNRKVLSLVSFDVKGAYNGVFKERLLQRLKARGIPENLVRWIGAFCSRRTATIVVNGYTSEQRELPQAGLPQGSPLSPILFLFFNADLVQHRTSAGGGSMAFMDDYTAWVTGPSAEANRAGIQSIIDTALDWERRSGATFEGEKTAIVHFTRNTDRSNSTAFAIKGEMVSPKESAKILGVVMDSQLRYKQHIARAAAKGLKAAMALRRLKMISPRTARQLFGATVAPVVDFASSVWMHACGEKATQYLNRVQKTGAIAITGAFRTVATAVAEAEANIRTFRERHMEKATKLWVDIHTLPETSPLAKLRTTTTRRFVSPLQKIAQAQQETAIDQMETIHTYAVLPWAARVQVLCEPDREKAMEMTNRAEGILIATSSSAKGDRVGMGGSMRDTRINDADETISYSITLGTRTEQNPYTAELAAIVAALKGVPWWTRNREVTILCSNRSALAAIGQPRQQSGQSMIQEIYDLVSLLREGGNRVSMIWAPKHSDFALGTKAKAAAQRATAEGCEPDQRPYRAKSTSVRLAIDMQRREKVLPEGVGKYSKAIDTALPGRHTRILYDGLKRKEANVLAQLRTGMTRLNSYLSKIGAAESDLCICGQASETVEHFLFRCTRWTRLREGMSQCTETRRGNLSFYLGGKARSDPERWKPDMKAVRATITYVLATGRLDTEGEQDTDQSQ
jgi:hypothetical protein